MISKKTSKCSYGGYDVYAYIFLFSFDLVITESREVIIIIC